MRLFRLGRVRILALLMLAVFLFGCGSASAPKKSDAPATTPAPAAGDAAAKPAAPKTLTPVTFMADWLVSGYSTPFFLAKEKGYFAEVGLDVTFKQGKGSGVNLQLVGNGQETFALAAIGNVAPGIAQGVPIKVVATYLQKNPAGIIYLPEKFNLTSPQDLIGKTGIYSPTGDPNLVALKAYMNAKQIPADKVQIRTADPNGRFAALLEKKVDFLGGFSNGDFQRIQAQRPDAKHLLIANEGINFLSTGLIVSNDTIKNKPDVVRGFVAAAAKGWQDTIKDPKAAYEAARKVFPDAVNDAVFQSLQGSLDFLYTEKSKGKPIGWMAPEDWQQTIDILTKYGDLAGSNKPATDYYTNDFISK